MSSLLCGRQKIGLICKHSTKRIIGSVCARGRYVEVPAEPQQPLLASCDLLGFDPMDPWGDTPENDTFEVLTRAEAAAELGRLLDRLDTMPTTRAQDEAALQAGGLSWQRVRAPILSRTAGGGRHAAEHGMGAVCCPCPHVPNIRRHTLEVRGGGGGGGGGMRRHGRLCPKRGNEETGGARRAGDCVEVQDTAQAGAEGPDQAAEGGAGGPVKRRREARSWPPLQRTSQACIKGGPMMLRASDAYEP